MLRCHRGVLLEIILQFVLVIDDLHCLATQNVAWPNEDGVANLGGRFDHVGMVRGGEAHWLLQVELVNDLVKDFPIFRGIETSNCGAQDLNPMVS